MQADMLNDWICVRKLSVLSEGWDPIEVEDHDNIQLCFLVFLQGCWGGERVRDYEIIFIYCEIRQLHKLSKGLMEALMLKSTAKMNRIGA